MQRRHFLLAGSGALAGALITACGGGDEVVVEPELLTRRSVTRLNTRDRNAFVETLYAMKRLPSTYDPATNAYDYFVAVHGKVFESHHSNAHMAAGFLPWHREMLKRFEHEMRRASGNATMTLPYWDWHEIGGHTKIFTDDFLGGNGDSSDAFLVKSGAFREGLWPMAAYFDPTPDEFPDTDGDGEPDREDADIPLSARGLTRRYAGDGMADIDSIMRNIPLSELFLRPDYDNAPYTDHMAMLSDSDHEAMERPSLLQETSMRKFLEVKWHNVVHAIIGGQMGTGTSPNDPAFFLHHCNVDRIWAIWQQRYGNAGYPLHDPVSGAKVPLHLLADAQSVVVDETFDLQAHSGIRYEDMGKP